jgi:hypothetical protein
VRLKEAVQASVSLQLLPAKEPSFGQRDIVNLASVMLGEDEPVALLRLGIVRIHSEHRVEVKAGQNLRYGKATSGVPHLPIADQLQTFSAQQVRFLGQ